MAFGGMESSCDPIYQDSTAVKRLKRRGEKRHRCRQLPALYEAISANKSVGLNRKSDVCNLLSTDAGAVKTN